MRHVLGVALLVVAGTGCKSLSSFDPPPPPPFRVAVLVEGDPGNPIAGASIQQSSKVLATTGPDGRAQLTFHGADGDQVDTNVRCPDGFTSPQKPLSVRISRLADGSRAPEFRVSCPPSMRHVVVAIRTDNGANLPVTYLGKQVAKTDASGAAHVAIDLPPGTGFVIGLDTTDATKIKPQMPSKPFTVGQSDDIFMWEQKFDVEKKKFVAQKTAVAKCLTCGKD
jgi:hypothetical protein